MSLIKSGRQKAEEEVESGDLPQTMISKLSAGKLLIRNHTVRPYEYDIKSREPKGTRLFYFERMVNMKKTTKFTAVLLALVISFTCLVPAFAYTPAQMTASLAKWLPKNISVSEVGADKIDFYLDWTVFAMARSGNNSFNEDYANYVGAAVKATAGKFTLADNARVALTAMAVGLNPRNVGGVDLIKAVSGADFSTETKTVPVAFALIALDSRGYFSFSQRKDLRNILLGAQRSDGGFNYMLKDTGGYTTASDVDSTAIVLQALAPYKRNSDVSPVINKALDYLQTQILSDGGYGSWGTGSAESASQVLTALSALKINPLSSEYVASSGKNILDSLSTYINTDGGGRCWNGTSDIMTSYQMLYGLNAYDRYKNGRASLYNMTDSAGGFSTIFFSIRRSLVIAFS